MRLLPILFFSTKVLGTTHQGNENFSESTRGTQCTTNSLLFLLKDAVARISSPSEIDSLLLEGDELHAAFNAALGRKTGGRLAFDEIEQSIKHILQEDQTLLTFGPVLHGDVLGAQSNPPFVTVGEAIKQASNATGALLRVGEYTTAVQINTDDSVRLFDPHARDDSGFVSSDGTAVVIVLKDTVEFHAYLKRFVNTSGTGSSTDSCKPSVPDSKRSFELVPLFSTPEECLQILEKSITSPNNESR